MSQQCGNCRFSRREWGKTAKEGAEWECRRNPPIAPTAFRGIGFVGRIRDLPEKEITIQDEVYEVPDTSEVLEPEHASWYFSTDEGSMHRLGEWPIVFFDHWCGEWRPQDSAEDVERVARAICAQLGINADDWETDAAGVKVYEWQRVSGAAAAALRAIYTESPAE